MVQNIFSGNGIRCHHESKERIVKLSVMTPVFRTFSGHPCNYLNINIYFVFLGVPKIIKCLLELRKTHLEVLVYR